MKTSKPALAQPVGKARLLSAAILIVVLFSGLPAVAQDAQSLDILRRMGKAFASIAEQASPAVVGIKAERMVASEQYPFFSEPFNPFENDPFNFFFRRQPRGQSPRQKQRQTAQGSGFIIESDGYILTNNHLVREADKVTVKLSDQREFEAEVRGTDPETDLAVLKIDAENLPMVELADSDKLEVGEWVIAIGNPFGLSHTVTAGIVSAKGRNIGLTAYEDFIQTDAAINPGNSGGPLLNLDGKVIGMNTAIISRTGGNMGIGLAIPINMAKNVYHQLVDSGKVIRGYLGVVPQKLTPELAKSLGLEEDTKGVVLTQVEEDSPADKAGLKHKDIIVRFNGKEVQDADSFRNNVAMFTPGTEVPVTIIRNGKKVELTVKLGNRSALYASQRSKSKTVEKLGLSVQELTDELAQRLGYQGRQGVIVSEVKAGSLADSAGIKAGMLIMEVNQKQVTTPDEFYEQVEKVADEGSVLLYLNNSRYNEYVVLRLP